MQSTLEHFTIKNAMVFATGGNSSALFFLWCGKVRYVGCVCGVWCVWRASLPCLYIWPRPSIKHGTRKFANKPDRMTLVASLPLPHARCRCKWQMPTIDIDSNSHQLYRTYPSPAPHLTSHTTRHTPLPFSPLPLTVCALQFACRMSPAIKLFSAAFWLFPTNLPNVSFYACLQSSISWQLMSRFHYALRFSLFALLSLSVSAFCASVSKELSH